MAELVDDSVVMPPQGRGRTFASHEIIVSKTDPKGIIRYVNDTFCRVSGFRPRELIGRPHNVIRHPFMPAAIFSVLWERLKARQEVFAYVVNRCRDGTHYWVLAHLTPSIAMDGTIAGFHSTRRSPGETVPPPVLELYAELRALELRATSRREGLQTSKRCLAERLAPWNGDLSAWTMALARGADFTLG